MSWHEDLARNLSRFFSRNKSADSEGNGSEVREAEGSGLHGAPEDLSSSAQESQPSDGDTASQSEDGWREEASAAPPADGFLRRLGSLLHFSRPELSAVQRETLTTSQRDTHTSADTQRSRAEPEHTHTPSEEQTEEDRSDAAHIEAKERLEDKRRYDLACPPVVTYGTYRGLREVKKPKKKHHVELHSPISEGEEATQPEGHEDNKISSFTVNTMSSESHESPTAVNQTAALQQIEYVSAQSDKLLTVESELTLLHQLPYAADSSLLLACVETDSVYKILQEEKSDSGLKSGQEHFAQSTTLESFSGDSDDLKDSDHHDTVPTLDQRSSLIVDRTDDLAPDSQACWIAEEFSLKRAGVDEEVLRLASKNMVDSILTNALAALQKMEECEMEGEVLSTLEPSEGSEATPFERLDGGNNAEHQFCVALTDQVLEETLAGHVDCSRSPPSSGYESIAGSDTDIRCIVGVASDITAASAPISSQNENQAFLEYLFEEKNTDGTCKSIDSAAADETLSHSLKDFLHEMDIKDSSEEHMGEKEWVKREKRSQDTAKDNAMSNNCRLSVIDSCAPTTHQESLQQSQTLSEREKSDPVSHSLASDIKYAYMMSETTPATQSHKSEAPYSNSGVQEQICLVSQAGEDSHDLLSGTEVQCSGGHPSSQWTPVRAIRCNVSDDQNLSPEEHLETAGASAECVSALRIHLDFVDSTSRTAAILPQHSRFHELDLHQVDGGFAIISEEEESDMVFVNDTGPMHSPSTRRARAYPFSLSPIYEEEFGREEPLGPEMLQVPPATEEEQRSVEQPATSILSLLQSVSEKLQSSVMCDSVEESINTLLSDDNKVDDENSRILQSHRLADDALGGTQEEQDIDGALGNIGTNVNTPFYQYLKSKILPPGDEEPGETQRMVCCSAGSTLVMGETRGFGKVNPRPAAVLVYESLSGERREICADVEDVGRDLFAHRGALHALRGCWLLYVDLFHRGSCVVLEEGQTVTTSGGSQQDLKETREPCSTDLSVLSVRTLLKDHSVPEIHLRPSSPQTIRLYSATDLTEPVLLSELHVVNGCWLVYEQPRFSGRSVVLETDGRVTTVLQNSLLSCVKSLRPLKMGGLQVTRPLDPKVLLFGKLQFQGQVRELLDHEPRLTDPAASLRVTGGIWVAFSSEGFRGHQCVLEEGEYSDCTRLFGGVDLRIQSLRCIQSDFLEPSISLKISDEEIEAHREIPDLQETSGVFVKSGVWVAYSAQCFSGQQCVLEKGCFPALLDWGDGRSSARSLRPVHREVRRIVEPKFLLRVYSQTQFSGESREFQSDVSDCGAPGVSSLRVIRGRWLLFDEERYSGNQYILWEGHYPDLTSCGCTSTAIKSLKPIPYSFAEPCVNVFSLSGFEGLEESFLSDAEDRSFFIQSVRVQSGLWVAYEYRRFKGRQKLLEPGEYPDWAEHSGWDTIGSMKPLTQPKAFVQLRSRALGLVLTSENISDGSFPAKLFLSPSNRSLDTQRWIFTDGLLKNTAQGGCLSVIGAKASPGAPVALWEEHGRINQRWSINEDGSICSHLNRSLALDLRGGFGADRDHLILRELHSTTQIWDVDVL
ncbi:beta/gamma crystallin domain-containing protein 3 isoform X2 [Puntigrus tetrazona]|uniref:beta/gamma crystallin domain-containing protein 3 isoform X2 n=1 Tax=Puntigrus tetrazona TaxID=1606681 RepID=UPI001C8ABD39|nr:beta/gamma crystallin domain-containing protein 3 isoform X2 [Puntigrus tetrazona]